MDITTVTEGETRVIQLQAHIRTLENELRQAQAELEQWKEKTQTDHKQAMRGVEDQNHIVTIDGTGTAPFVRWDGSTTTSITTTPLSTSTHRFHTIQFHPGRPIGFIERLPGSVLIHSLGPFLTGDEMLKLGFSSGRIMNSLHPDFSTAPYHYPSESIGSNDIWCLKIITRDGAFKESHSNCRYFRTKEEAQRAQIEEGREYMENEYRPEYDPLNLYPLLKLDENPLADKYDQWDQRISAWRDMDYPPLRFFTHRIQIEQLNMNEEEED